MGSEPEGDDGSVRMDSSTFVEDRLQGRPLENVHTCFIKPSSATPSDKEWLPLSKLDYLWVQFYTPLLCTFPLKEHRFGSTSGVVQHLKDSLADALVLFYPLAGSLVVTKDGPPRIHCNDAGAVFTEASMDMELAELRTDDFQPVPSLSGMAAAGLECYPNLPQTPTGLPALVVQVTHFKCGGITLAANWAHGVADGQSGLHFMKSWSELARGVEVSLLPDHRRDLLKPRNPPIPSYSLKPRVESAEAQIDPSKGSVEVRSEGNNAERSNSGASGVKTKAEKPIITSKIVEFTKDELAKLKQVAMDHDASLQLTRADCLSTHLWRTIARARNLPSSARVRLWILVEGRKKLALPPGYFGNIIGIMNVVTTVNELLNGPFGSTADLIHSGISSITAEWFQGLNDWVHVQGTGKIQISPESFDLGCEWGASYLIRFPFYELDFGFGIPAHSMRNTMGAWDGLVFIVPSSHSPYHMVAMANLDPDVMSNFVSMAHDIPE